MGRDLTTHYGCYGNEICRGSACMEKKRLLISESESPFRHTIFARVLAA